jgi:hypothetical protein
LLGGGVRVFIVVVVVLYDDGKVVDKDSCGPIELTAAVALFFVEDVEELGKEAALLGVLGLLAVSEPGCHGFTSDFFEFCDVDTVVRGWAVRVLVYDEADTATFRRIG